MVREPASRSWVVPRRQPGLFSVWRSAKPKAQTLIVNAGLRVDQSKAHSVQRAVQVTWMYPGVANSLVGSCRAPAR